MIKTEPSPLEINRNVRRILVANWIDLGRISLHSVKQSVFIRGSLKKLPGSDSDLTSNNLDTMYQKIRQLEGIRNVYMELDNWSRNELTGSWEKIGEQDKKAAAQRLLDHTKTEREREIIE